MHDINFILKSKNPEVIQDDIEEREELIKNMVGKLYPGIIRNEIDALKLRLLELEINKEIELNYFYLQLAKAC